MEFFREVDQLQGVIGFAAEEGEICAADQAGKPERIALPQHLGDWIAEVISSSSAVEKKKPVCRFELVGIAIHSPAKLASRRLRVAAADGEGAGETVEAGCGRVESRDARRNLLGADQPPFMMIDPRIVEVPVNGSSDVEDGRIFTDDRLRAIQELFG